MSSEKHIPPYRVSEEAVNLIAGDAKSPDGGLICWKREYLQEQVQTDALLESAIQHNDVQEVERLRVKMAALSSLGETRECRPVWNGEN